MGEEERPAPLIEAPADHDIARVFELRCKWGHHWFAYGPNEREHFGPVLCWLCPSNEHGAVTGSVAIGHRPHETFLFRRRFPTPGQPDGTILMSVDADQFEPIGGGARFHTDGQLVAEVPADAVANESDIRRIGA